MLDEDFKLSNPYYVWEAEDGSVYEYIDYESLKNTKKVFNRIKLVFRDNVLNIDLPKDSYIYFSFGVGKELTSEDDISENYFIIGKQIENSQVIKKTWYKVPELIIRNSKEQNLYECPRKCLYYNGKGIQQEIMLPF